MQRRNSSNLQVRRGVNYTTPTTTTPSSHGKPKEKGKVDVLDSEKERDEEGNIGAPWPRPTRNVTDEVGVWMPATARLSMRSGTELPPKVKGRSNHSMETDDTIFTPDKDDPARRITKKMRDLGDDRDLEVRKSPGTTEQMQDVAPAMKSLGPETHAQDKSIVMRRRRVMSKKMRIAKPPLKLFDKVVADDGTKGKIAWLEERWSPAMKKMVMVAQLNPSQKWYVTSSLSRVGKPIVKRADANSVNWEPKDPFLMRLMSEIVHAVDRWNENWEEMYAKVVKQYKLDDREQALLQAYMNDYGYRVTNDPFGIFDEEKYAPIFSKLNPFKRRKTAEEQVQNSFQRMMESNAILDTVRRDLRSIGELDLVAMDKSDMSNQINTVLSKLKSEPSRYGTVANNYADVQAAISTVQQFAEQNSIPVATSLVAAKLQIPVRAIQKSTNHNHISMVRQVNRMNHNIDRMGKISGEVQEELVKRGFRNTQDYVVALAEYAHGVDENDQKLAQVTSVLGTVNTDLERLLRIMEGYYKPVFYGTEINQIELPRDFGAGDESRFRIAFGSVCTELSGHLSELHLLKS